jgi:RimJ/RimL family protein N-acetyltransferase
MKAYKCLAKQKYALDKFQIVPIRDEDRYDIMHWRNEQIYHLRQSKPLDKISQDYYFEIVIAKIFEKERPDQILFSYLENEKCIGYGGLVHINWVDKNAELSFIMKTSEEIQFDLHWSNFLALIEQVAYNELNFHKIFTYAFDLRPHLYNVLEKNGFIKEATLKEHCYFMNTFINVVLHSKIKGQNDECCKF